MKLHEASDAALLTAYIKLREARATRKSEYEAADADDKAKQDKLEMEFLRRFNERGTDNTSAHGVGTAYISNKISVTVGDRDAYFNWIAENFDERNIFLENRANKTAVEQFRAANDDLPPGVNWSVTRTVNFRRPDRVA